MSEGDGCKIKGVQGLIQRAIDNQERRNERRSRAGRSKEPSVFGSPYRQCINPLCPYTELYNEKPKWLIDIKFQKRIHHIIWDEKTSYETFTEQIWVSLLVEIGLFCPFCGSIAEIIDRETETKPEDYILGDSRPIYILDLIDRHRDWIKDLRRVKLKSTREFKKRMTVWERSEQIRVKYIWKFNFLTGEPIGRIDFLDLAKAGFPEPSNCNPPLCKFKRKSCSRCKCNLAYRMCGLDPYIREEIDKKIARLELKRLRGFIPYRKFCIKCGKVDREKSFEADRFMCRCRNPIIKKKEKKKEVDKSVKETEEKGEGRGEETV
jgi:hypothetical protein